MRYKEFFLWVFLCLAVGTVAGFLQQEALQEWYPRLEKSSLTPPGSVFFVVWTVLYILMGLSIAFARQTEHAEIVPLTRLFLVQLAVNFLWSVSFFLLRNPMAGLFVIFILLLLIVWYLWMSKRISRLAFQLFLPYVLWVCFALYLNLYMVVHNSQA